ncbi:hypothetical protein AGOR_G00196970 [Albula goreensis]|uniref:ZP domain-containing protein n=1 Tax=Albula goreensis TaxID=1534307 RepID=A0A8T3CSJ8_9TELE|nr:hypothetical protein AGOR_G00196970 [Albula goreensis]
MCNMCHQDAICHKSPAAQGVTLECRCMAGFVGDGLACYNRAACEGSQDCCEAGYCWSSEQGCLDVDECSIPGEICSPPLVCENTPGSYDCLLPREEKLPARSAATSSEKGQPDTSSKPISDKQSIRFSCGGVTCPAGYDCVSFNGTHLCLDPCQNYSVLNDSWRATDFSANGNTLRCDNTGWGGRNWQGWYRMFLGITAFRCQRDVNTTVCGTCREDETCVSEDKITWRCERQDRSAFPTPELVCWRSFIRVGLNRAALLAGGLDASSAHLINFNCTAYQESNGMVWFQVQRRMGSCGTHMRTNDTHAVYSNSVFVYPSTMGKRMPARFPFSCTYPLETEVSLDVPIRLDVMEEAGVVGTGPKPWAEMSVYRNADYTNPYYGDMVVLPLGSPLHVGVSVMEASSNGLAVILEDCYITHSADPHDPDRYTLIHRRCPLDHQLVTVEETRPFLPGRFTATLSFLYSYDPFFVHCSVVICDHRWPSCSQGGPVSLLREAPDHRTHLL